jgi:hypothetical protein
MARQRVGTAGLVRPDPQAALLDAMTDDEVLDALGPSWEHIKGRLPARADLVTSMADETAALIARALARHGAPLRRAWWAA